MMVNMYLARPKIGTRLDNSRHGIVTVVKVRKRGLVLDVVDAIGRPWQVERASSGWWRRATP